MKLRLPLLFVACLAGSALLAPWARAGVKLGDAPPSVVTTWNEIATTTINQPAAPTGTPEEQRPIYGADLASMHVAMHDAVAAITGSYKPLAVTARAPAGGASPEAAVTEAAYRVLLGLFPARRASYQPAYERFLQSLPEGPARQRGLDIGAEVAAGVLAWRAADGRSVVLPEYVPGQAPGQYRGKNPIGRMWPNIKPFALTSNAQFRAPGPPALGSARYAQDFERTSQLGAAASTTRKPEQTEIARFHSEPPFQFWPRNFRRLVAPGSSIAEQARLMALLWVTHVDATNACFESKYHYQFWRPLDAIALADDDGNDATRSVPGWAPLVPTPPHPEYPAAHGCVTGALATALRGFYGRSDLAFDFSSNVTASTRHYESVDELVEEVNLARIAGGMHFQSATVDGTHLGTQVANWALTQKFKP